MADNCSVNQPLRLPGYSRRVLDVAKNKDGEAGLGLLLNFDGDNQRFTKSVGQPLKKTPPAETPVQTSMFRPEPSRGPTPFDKEVS